MTVRVAIADDQSLVRDGFRVQLGLAGDLEFAGEASTGDQAVALARTSVTAFLGEPNRLRIVSAKLVSAALTGAAVGLLAEALSAVTSAAALSAHHIPLDWSQPGVASTLLAVPLLAALFGVLGASLGLLRNTAAALGLALMWAFVVEGIIPALTHAPGIVRWLPEAAANAVLHGTFPTATTLSVGAALAGGRAGSQLSDRRWPSSQPRARAAPHLPHRGRPGRHKTRPLRHLRGLPGVANRRLWSQVSPGGSA